jgi:streptogramin lyase
MGCSVEVNKLRPHLGAPDAPADRPQGEDGPAVGDADAAKPDTARDVASEAAEAMAKDADGLGLSDRAVEEARPDDSLPEGDAADAANPGEETGDQPDLGADDDGLAEEVAWDAEQGGDLLLDAGPADVADNGDVPYGERSEKDGRGNDLPDGQASPIIQYPIPTPSSQPWGITVGPDKKLWFTERSGNKIGRVSLAGEFDEIPLPFASSAPYGIATGPDNNIWFTEYAGNSVGRIATDGTLNEYALPAGGGGPTGIEASALGNYVWITESTGNKLARISTSGTTLGTFSEFTLPTGSAMPSQIVVAPDPNNGYWFTERTGNKLGRVTLAAQITEPTSLGGGSGPEGIVVGPDGDVWFTEYSGNKIGRVAATGTPTTFSIPTSSSQPACITKGPDGNLWFTEYGGHKIGRITPAGEITEFSIPGKNSAPRGIVTGPDNNIWFVESGGNNVSYIVP